MSTQIDRNPLLRRVPTHKTIEDALMLSCIPQYVIETWTGSLSQAAMWAQVFTSDSRDDAYREWNRLRWVTPEMKYRMVYIEVPLLSV